MGLNAAVQALKKAEPLKDKVQRCKDLLNDNDAWVCQQQLQKIYQQVLILDLEYALDRKVEQELWNLGFKNYIAMLQCQAKDRKNPKRSESQAMLSWCLEAASGFYLTLLQEICTAFDLDLPFRRKGYIYGCISPWKAVERLSKPHKSSCFYACQYCLVHLGDIARYRNQNKQAELFYRHAVSLSPSSGQPYNQLALLEASRGDKLGTVFHYVRSVALKHPFPVATANLTKTLSSALNDHSFNITGKTKLNSQEFVSVFLKLHGILHNLEDLKTANDYIKMLTENLTALVATESLSPWRLVQMLVIDLYALHHAAGNSFETSMDLLKIDQLSSDEKLARNYILDLIAGSLSSLLFPVYTTKNSYLDYVALPTIKLCLDWIRLQPAILEDIAFTSRLQIWPSLCMLLNGLQDCITDFQFEQYSKNPLPEDRDLQGFLPIEKSFESLRFCNTDLEGDVISIKKLRAVRLLNHGRYLAQCRINGSTLINIISGGQKIVKFACVTEVNGPSSELIKELEELSLNKERQINFTSSPVPSESASSKGSSETEIIEQSLFEKRIGILKPQGSLERNRDSLASSSLNSDIITTNVSDVNGHPSTRKTRQNIAMQAILRRAETEQKQVTFKNISPMIVEEINPNKSQPESEIFNQIPTPIVPTFNQTQTFDNVTSKPAQFPKKISPVAINIQSLQNHQKPLIKDYKQVTMNLGNNQCFPCNQQNLQQSPEFSYTGLSTDVYNPQKFNSDVNAQDRQFDKGFIVNQLPCMTQFPIHQFNMQQSVQRVPIVQQTPNASNASHPNVHINIPTSICHQHQVQQEQIPVPNLQFMEPNRLRQPQPQQQQQKQQQREIGITGIGNLINYQKNIQSNFPINSQDWSNLQMGFNQAQGQNGFDSLNQVGQVRPINQIGSSTQFNKPPNLSTNLTFSNQVSQPTTSHQQTGITYPMFRSYETPDFNVWQDTQPPQPPPTWWASGGPQNSLNDIPVSSENDSFQCWGNTSAVGRLPMPLENSFNQQSLSSSASTIGKQFGTEENNYDQNSKATSNTANTYSLFSGNSWGNPTQNNVLSSQDQSKIKINQQSLWSGPGPSPLERLLEQQKSLREGGT